MLGTCFGIVLYAHFSLKFVSIRLVLLLFVSVIFATVVVVVFMSNSLNFCDLF